MISSHNARSGHSEPRPAPSTGRRVRSPILLPRFGRAAPGWCGLWSARDTRLMTGHEEFELGTDGPRMIVVGLDGSRTSWRAASYANGLVRSQGSRVAVVYVASAAGL